MTPEGAIARIVGGASLVEDEMAELITAVLEGRLAPSQLGALCVGLRMKGESVDELVGAARTMRTHMTRVPDVPANAIDTCGTGGDGSGTFNISTAAALVVAAAGVPVAKHGNRAASGTVGGADVLEALGVELVLEPATASACLRETGFAFLFAPAFHPALKHAAAVRRELGIRTIFNLLGPLANPAGVRRQVLGVAERRWVEPMAHVLRRLGVERAWVVHGTSGLDELELEGTSVVAEVTPERIAVREIDARDLGLAPAPLSTLRVASREEAVARLRELLAGAPGPAHDVVCLNAAAALVVAGAAPDLAIGLATAARTLASGAVASLLDRLLAFTRRGGSRA
jgi:anthranilate phosphoribosyltransferase